MKLLLLPILLLLTACESMPAYQAVKKGGMRREAKRNTERMAGLHLGQSREDVIRTMGTPGKSEAYELKNGRQVEFLFYRTRGSDVSPWSAAWMNNKLDKDDQYTAIGIENGKVIGWGPNFYDQMVNLELQPRNPSESRE